MMQNDIYKTEDFYLCLALCEVGFQLEDIVFDSLKRKASFYFPCSQELLKSVDAYWAKQIKVEVQSYMMTYRIVKNRLNEIKKQNGILY